MTSSRAVILPLVPDELEVPPSDGELVGRALQRDRVALQLLYQRHVRAVTQRVTLLLSRSAEAEDVVQDAFESAFRDLQKLVDRARFDAWLMRIAVHQVHRRFRRRRLLARLGLDRGMDDARLERIVDPAASPETRADLGRLDHALGRLPPGPRLAWMLRYIEGCELKELAEQCGCSLATAKRRVAQADVTLRAALGSLPFGNGGDHE